MSEIEDPVGLEERYGVRNYDPLPVVISRGEGSWVEDVDGRRYFDALSAYSALNFGHRHPRLVAAAREQLDRLTLTSRAFRNDRLGELCRRLALTCSLQRVLPMNTGAEAVETGIKAARKWGYEVKGVERDRAKIVVCRGNFHGRTTTIVSFSDDPVARAGFGPFTPGFETVPFGDLEALEGALDDETVALLVEPVQGEAGVIIPPEGYLSGARRLCSDANVLMVADEIQSGLGRTGRLLACDHEGVRPDLLLLGKALGGGILPISAVVGTDEVLGLFEPGQHGSTFGGNPLACAVALEALALLEDGALQENAAALGARFLDSLRAAAHPAVTEIRQRGLWIGVNIDAGAATARSVCERLLAAGVLAKETQRRTIRFAPPLTTTAAELDWVLERVNVALGEL
ncbi:MAG TPA: ornithine--oxo-acid transaminase [Solirubrobacterales bacterium]|nr:ornithine--oxo-acid transaminase [Solirubrobacterales bacterium]